MELTQQQIKKEIEKIEYAILMETFAERMNFEWVRKQEKEIEKLEKLLN